MSTMPESERILRARIGGLRLHALHDTLKVSAPGREAATRGLNERLLAEIDPGRLLAPAERDRRLALARRAHFTRLAYKSARARNKRTAAAWQSETAGRRLLRPAALQEPSTCPT